MRVALQRLLASPSALRLPQSTINPEDCTIFGCQTTIHAATDTPTSKRGELRPLPSLRRYRYATPDPYYGMAIERRERRRLSTFCFASDVPNVSEQPEVASPRIATQALNKVQLEEQEHNEALEGVESLQLSLMDEPQNTQNWELWIDVLRFQEHYYGTGGVIAVLRKVKERDLCLPTEGRAADVLWPKMLQASLQETRNLEELLEYAYAVKMKTGKMWRRLCVTIMLSKLDGSTLTAMEWHRQWAQLFNPPLDDYREVLEKCIKKGCIEVFAQIYNSADLHPVYGVIVPTLCTNELFEHAADWHLKLVKVGDLPLQMSDLEPLLLYYSRRDEEMFGKLVTSVLTSKGVLIQRSLNKFLKTQQRVSKDVAERQITAITREIPKPQLSDAFCARLFATRFFRVDSVITGLGTMGLDFIGPSSVREIVLRNDYCPASVCRHFDRLREAGIALSKSKYIAVIRKAAIAHQRWLLQSIVDFDAHPDTYEDNEFQERIFAVYFAQGDTVALERTLTVLNTDVPQDYLEEAKVNTTLRAALRLKNHAKLHSILGHMRARGIHLTPQSGQLMRKLLLRRRRRGSVGVIDQTLESTDLLINVMVKTLTDGLAVPILAWKELLKRLGMTGQLAKCKSLSLWLASFYMKHPEKGVMVAQNETPYAAQVTTQSDRPSNKASENHCSNSSASSQVVSTNSSHKANPATQQFAKLQLARLFDKGATQSLITWGFQQDAKLRQAVKRLSQANHDECPNCTWGLTVLRRLRESGVVVHDATVAKYCKQRLLVLFGKDVRSRQAVNRSAQQVLRLKQLRSKNPNQYTPSSYAKMLERAWGRKLWSTPPFLEPQTDNTRLDSRERWDKIWRVMKKRRKRK